jgi:predicted transcriptional regulator
MERKRNRLEIIKDILQVVREKSGRIKPTHILYKSNLSYQMMESYLSELIGKGFLTEGKNKNGKTYFITEKGLNYLSKYNLISEFTSSFGLSEEA